MLDFGESRNVVVLDVDLERKEDTLPYADWDTILFVSVVCRGGVNGEEWFEVFVARLVVLVRGDGVNGMRPPAVLVEKMP